jgi:hypothetical protein
MGGVSPRVATAVASGLVAVALLACAALAPPDPPSGSATAWGFVRLVPREGVVPGSRGGASPYADPALRDVEFVDYSRPGFAVIYLEATPSPRGLATVRIRDGQIRPYLDPGHAAVGVGGTLRVENASGEAHVLSLPDADRVRRIAPGEAVEVELAEAGAHALFVLDVPEAAAEVFVAPGRFAIASPGGRFELRDLPPGRLRLDVWHPRFPPTSRDLELVSGRALRVDLELGVGSIAEHGDGG